jgi:hypothetical protein
MGGGDWHRAHPLPRRATELQRLFWHLEHQRCCGCRPMPAYLAPRNDITEPRKKRPARKPSSRSRDRDVP